ncbi:MAG: LytTR family transcriptional regulator [Lachnospiraceae bacterium]|nr:LytTR family transcriptional regulator [Lachnospiraceae bacterium]
MAEKQKSISVMVNRKECQIPLESIVYAQVSDKLCTIYLYGGTPPIRIFLTMNALEEMLPQEMFVKVSRSYLISLNYYQHMDDSRVLLAGDVRVPYSHSHKNEIRGAVQRFQATNAVEQSNPEVRNRILDEFHGFDHFPLPFCVVENMPNGRRVQTASENLSKGRMIQRGSGSIPKGLETQRGSGSIPKGPEAQRGPGSISGENALPRDFVLRYVNDAFAAYAGRSAWQLVNASFFSVFACPDERWAEVLSQCSTQNQRMDAFLPGVRPGAVVRAYCYQPYFSFCGCLLTELDVQKRE